ncbi:MAG: vWA domain-containing protein [Treponemataceae bacterium]|nr:vWA domain-containing protein [Treponemataceae bacterium]
MVKMLFSADNGSMKVFNKFFSFFLILSVSISAFCADLKLTSDDIKVERDETGSFHIYIRKKDGVGSVLLTESSKNPEGESDNYSYRAKEWNPINGDEKRILDGKFLESAYSRYSIVDSTPEIFSDMGECFHLYVPETIVYGYPWSRNGEVQVGKGTFLNIRCYEKPYADYSGAFYDNPFMVSYRIIEKPKVEEPVYIEPEVIEEVVEEIVEEPIEEVVEEVVEEVELTDEYNSEAANSFQDLADMNNDLVIISAGPETLIEDIMKCIKAMDPSKPCDIVFAIDATGSMKDDIEKLRQELIPRLETEFVNYVDVRIGLLLYRDYGDNFKYKDLPIKMFHFTKEMKTFKKNLNGFKIKGNEGGDIPEAVYEALYGSIQFFEWNADSQKKIILIGDAQPHPRPRGKIICSKEIVQELANKNDIHIDTIIVPDKKG